jgi:hypothetical protein
MPCHALAGRGDFEQVQVCKAGHVSPPGGAAAPGTSTCS